MSTGGQAIGGLVGGIIGFFTPIGPLYGAQIGMMIGGYIDPPKGPKLQGPRLSDLSVQTSTYGAFIPRGYGTFPVFGNVFWLEGNRLKETATKHKQGGKGGGGSATTTTYSYSATFAVGLLDCSDGVPISGVRRIWIGSKLFYDAASTDVDTIRASNVNAQYFKVYFGDENQSPDPRIQADRGVANTPAYRGFAYIVFYDLDLTNYGNSLVGAQVKVELVKVGTTAYESVASAMPNADEYLAVAWGDGLFVAPSSESDTVATSINGIDWVSRPLPESTSLWQAAAHGVDSKGFSYWVLAGLGEHFARSTNGANWILAPTPGGITANFSSIAFGNGLFVAVTNTADVTAVSDDGGINWSQGTLPAVGYRWTVAFGDGLFVAVRSSSDMAAWSEDGILWTATTLPGNAHWEGITYGNGVWVVTSKTNNEVLTSSDGKTWVSQGYVLPSGSQWAGITYGAGLFVAVRGGNAVVATSPDGVTWTGRTTVDFVGNSVAYGEGIFVCAPPNLGNPVVLLGERISHSTVLLSSIIDAECLSSGMLDSGDIDTTALTQAVRGYRVSQLGALRAAIDPLRAAWPFDVIQSGYQIKFQPRGQSSVATIDESELAAGPSGEATGVRLTDSREMDIQLPRRVYVSHFDPDREYGDGQQYDERINTTAVNVTNVELPIVLTSAEAAKVAQTLLYLYWLERHDLSFTLPPAYLGLEDADIVTINAAGGVHELRITSLSRLPDGRMEGRAKYNRAAVYVPNAVGEAGVSTGQTLSLPGSTVMELIDIPAVVDSMDSPGFMVAANGRTAGWPGAVISRSDDGGQSWSDVAALTSSGSTFGYSTNAIGNGRTDIIDTASILAVNLVIGELSGVTQLAMLNGANHFAYGTNGRWEIIAAQNCVEQADGSYLLSNLLRGRFGTEWAVGEHQVGDAVVLINTELSWVESSSNTINLERYYRASTFGNPTSSAVSKQFTYAGTNLECLASVYPLAVRNPSTFDWTLTWIPRTRTGGEWRDYVDAPVGETVEAYEVDIYAGNTFTTIKRTISSSSPSVAYSSTQQIADFGVVQPVVYAKIYKISATVGRGYALTWQGQASNSITWSSQSSAADNEWFAIAYSASLGLFAAVSASGTGNRVMTSPDGINWTARASASNNNWYAVSWSPTLGIFAAVSASGTGNRVMTSPDGINWTSRSSAADNDYYAICWGGTVFVALSSTGTGNRVMTSPDGINWTLRSSAADYDWSAIAYSPSLGLFAAVSASGTGNRVMTSPDGINWTSRNSAADNDWRSIDWSPTLGLFAAVASTGTGNRVMTSPDGINWTLRSSAADNLWRSVAWSSALGMFAAVSSSGTGTRVMTSHDGIDWVLRSAPADNNWFGVAASTTGIFAAVGTSGTGNRVMTGA